MGMDQKRESLENRRQEIKRELTGLTANRHGESSNTALGDLERALSRELDEIDRQLKLLHDYVRQVQPENPRGE
jgi:hypothetical protein